MYTHIFLILKQKMPSWLARIIVVLMNPHRAFYMGWKKNIPWMVKMTLWVRISLTNQHRKKALKWVIKMGFTEVLSLFDLSPEEKLNAYFWSVRSLNFDIIKLMYHPVPKSAKILGYHTVEKIIKNEKTEILDYLADILPLEDVIFLAIVHNKIDILRKYYKPGIEKMHYFAIHKETIEFLGDEFQVNHASLQETICHGDLNTIKFLMDRGLNLQKWGRWMLKCAAAQGKIPILKFLLNKGFNPFRQFLLEAAVPMFGGSADTFKWLASNSNLNTGTKRIFKIAIGRGSVGVQKYLVENCRHIYSKPHMVKFILNVDGIYCNILQKAVKNLCG